MTPQRPPVVLVLAVFCFLAGGIGACCNASGALYPFGEAVVDRLSDDGTDPETSGFHVDLGKSRADVALWGMAVGEVPLSVLLIVVGVGLLHVRRWARRLALIVAVLLILATATEGVLTYYSSTIKQDPDLGPVASVILSGSSIFVVAGQGLLWVGLATALLIVLLRPSIRQAFAQNKPTVARR